MKYCEKHNWSFNEAKFAQCFYCRFPEKFPSDVAAGGLTKSESVSSLRPTKKEEASEPPAAYAPAREGFEDFIHSARGRNLIQGIYQAGWLDSWKYNRRAKVN